MFSWNNFPYTDFNKVNLDWITRQISACGTFWTCSDASLVIDPDRGTGVSFYMADMTGPAGDAEPKQGDAVFYSMDSITYCAFIDDVVGAGGGNPEFISFRIYRMTGPQGEPGESGGGGTGLTEDIKQALLQLASNVAYLDNNGPTYYQDLYDALYDVEPPATLVSIDAVYTQSGTVYDTDTLNSLKTDIVVTATYSDSSTAIIPAADYTLSGSLTVGTSTITVSYGGQTDTFTVTVTENPAPPVTLVSIDAVYTQSGTVYDTDTLDSLKTDLVVTATYSDSSTAVIPAADYTLSGTLTVGSSVITVSYSGKTDTFSVTVTATPVTPTLIHSWDFTQSLVDSVGGLEFEPRIDAQPTRDSSGLHFTAATQEVHLTSEINFKGKTLEVDVASAVYAGNDQYHSRFIILNASTVDTGGRGILIYRAGLGWAAYAPINTNTPGWSDYYAEGAAAAMYTLISGKTVKMVCSADTNEVSMYLDNTLVATITANIGLTTSNTKMTYLHIGGTSSGQASAGNQFYNVTLTGLRIYG